LRLGVGPNLRRIDSIFTHADRSCVGVVFSGGYVFFVCLSVFLHDISKTDAARTIKLDT